MNFNDLQEEIWGFLGCFDAAQRRDWRRQKIRDAINQTMDELVAAAPYAFRLIRETALSIVPGTTTYGITDWTIRPLGLYTTDVSAHEVELIEPRTADREGYRNPNIQFVGQGPYKVTMAPRTATAYRSGSPAAGTGVSVTEGSTAVRASTITATFKVAHGDLGYASIQTATAHGLSVGDIVSIALSPADENYDGFHVVTLVQNSTAFEFSSSATQTITATAGTVSKVPFETADVGRMFRLNGEDTDYKIQSDGSLDRPVRSRLSLNGTSGVGSGYTNVRWEVGPPGQFQILVLPNPTLTRTLMCRHMEKRRRLVNPDETPELDETLHHLLWKGALRQVTAGDENQTAYQLYAGEFADALEQFKRADQDDALSREAAVYESNLEFDWRSQLPRGTDFRNSYKGM